MWKNKSILVTGGASFIGSHLTDSLLAQGAHVRVADDFSSGELRNLEYDLKQDKAGVWKSDNLEVYQGDLKERPFTAKMMEDIDVVFHLAALHGGRGYIDSHPADCCTNMILDQLVFEEANKSDVDRVCFASSACVYPGYLQEAQGSDYLLKEPDAHPFERDKAQADLEYGWAKFMGEMSLSAYYRQYGMKTSSVRIFTAYGPRENETHAIIALIAKAFVHMDPYVIWGSGKQDRNFTYVSDIVSALMLSAEKVTDGSATNAGRADRITMDDTCEVIFDILGWRPSKIHHDTTKPEGVASRAADISIAKKRLGWEPKVSYKEGFAKTIDWYVKTHDVNTLKKDLERLLVERKVVPEHKVEPLEPQLTISG